MKDKAEIYLAGGCFWGTEHFLKQIRGVEQTEVGYANSQVPNPTYKEVCTGNTGAVETVKVVYDPRTVDLDLLLDLYFQTIDPTSVNRQGGDSGLQYRTGIYYIDKDDAPVIEAAIKDLAKDYAKPIAIEVMPLVNFYAAEEYHQDYLDKNVGGYCHINPKLFELARKANARPVYAKPDDVTLKNKLSDIQYAVTQKMPRSLHSAMSTGMSIGKESMSILRLVNRFSYLPISLIPAVAGPVFPNRLIRN